MRQDHESAVQRAIVAYLRRVLPDAIVHHSANEGVRGGKAGWLDGALAKSAGQVVGMFFGLSFTRAWIIRGIFRGMGN